MRRQLSITEKKTTAIAIANHRGHWIIRDGRCLQLLGYGSGSRTVSLCPMNGDKRIAAYFGTVSRPSLKEYLQRHERHRESDVARDRQTNRQTGRAKANITYSRLFSLRSLPAKLASSPWKREGLSLGSLLRYSPNSNECSTKGDEKSERT
jgi:hypothetical protein